MLKNVFVKATCVFMALVLFGGCVSSTTMMVYATDPNGRPVDSTTVIVNGKDIGKTPYAKGKFSNFAGSDVLITVSKEGYYTTNTQAAKEPKAANILMGIFLINPFAFLWVSGPKAIQDVVLLPETTAE